MFEYMLDITLPEKLVATEKYDCMMNRDLQNLKLFTFFRFQDTKSRMYARMRLLQILKKKYFYIVGIAPHAIQN